MLVLGKGLRNNAPLTILSNTPSRYLLQYHQSYSLQYVTHANHISTPLTLPSLVQYPCHPRWHVTLACRPRNPRQHVAHAGTSPTLARYQRKHTTQVSTPPMQARYLRQSQQHKQHAIFRTSGYPIKLLKFLGFKFQEEIHQF